MTDEQMNEFLESIGGLENGYFTDREPIKDCWIFECGNGWFPLIKELIEDLIALGWDRKTCQVKEKFGGLRFYITSGSDAIYDRISQAEFTCVVFAEHSHTSVDSVGNVIAF